MQNCWHLGIAKVEDQTNNVFLQECGTRILQPLLLAFLIRSYGSDEPQEQTKSYYYAAGIVLTAIAYPLTHHPYFFEVTHVGMKMRVACCSLVYRKVGVWWTRIKCLFCGKGS